MEQTRVVTILESLANGAGATPEVVNALRVAVAAVKQKPAAAGARWTNEEDAQLCSEYDGGAPVAEIAPLHNRSKTAITLRLVKLGRIDPATVRIRDRSAM
ncbi:MAG TPA: hypothetical protein VN181_14705 [Thermoanaerobaculia bacterium]|nr:hypothetical protein [Thermoanaerobaculia bacterium]